MRLKQLLEAYKQCQLKSASNPLITGLSTHSKGIKPGELYVAVKGSTFDGRDFIPEVIASKAAGVITDLYNPLLDKKFAQVITPHPLECAQVLAQKFYHPLETLIGVTGTNGKTTVSFCIQQLFQALKIPCALIGTCHSDTLGSKVSSTLTTPDGVNFSRLVHESKLGGAQALVTEVSSHALDQQRLKGHKFQITVFTNLTHDHLDYHKTFERYGAAKLQLFLDDYRPQGSSYAVINLDDPFATTIIDNTHREVITYSLINPKATFYFKDLTIESTGIRGFVCHKDRSYGFKTHLLGSFNAANLLAAIATAYCKQPDLHSIVSHLGTIEGAPGRLEKVTSNIYIDFAHTPDGLLSVLKVLKQLPFSKIRLLFGCGGDRDQAKRPLMAKVAETFADELYITSDNPRHEDPEKIIQEIVQGLKNPGLAQVIVNRKEALKQAVLDLDPDTILLIAGKGHEKTQIVGHQSLPFDERALIEEFLCIRS